MDVMQEFGDKDKPRGGIRNRNYRVGDQAKETLERIDDSNEVLRSFRMYGSELDKRHDKFERLVKLSRDITIESKRIIFLLHSITRDSKKVPVLKEAETRLENLITKHWKSVAKELQNEDPYLFHKAFSPGMQEFIEAFSFFNYLKNKKILHWEHYQKKLSFDSCDQTNTSETEMEAHEMKTSKISAAVIPVDFVLGLADATGELMRKCINSLGEGDTQGCFETCNFVRDLHSGFLLIGRLGVKEMSYKASTLRQSLLKMEMICYTIHVRGSEAFKYFLIDDDKQET